MATKKWIPIVVGIAIFVVLVGAGLVGGFAYMVAQQVKVQEMPAAAGQEEFDRVVARFAGQQAFIEMPGDSGGETKVHHELETHGTGSISTLRICAWSPRDRKLVNVDLPFWMMRLTGNRPMELHAGSSGAVVLEVTPEQVDRRGPGLVLNHTRHRGDRLVIWTE
jgi:hypothetical protein